MKTSFSPDQTDFALLDALQDDLPLEPNPWSAIADRLGIPETGMLNRMKTLAGAGIIRGISPVLESRPFGLNAATLVALPVPVERIEEVAAIVSSFSEVSHNFQRDHHYSLWFTITAENDKKIRDVLDAILERSGIPKEDILDLPTVKKIKIDVRFSFSSAPRETPHGKD